VESAPAGRGRGVGCRVARRADRFLRRHAEHPDDVDDARLVVAQRGQGKRVLAVLAPTRRTEVSFDPLRRRLDPLPATDEAAGRAHRRR
jgi:hypothetical protein